jgi:adenosylhomocysteinase
VALRAKGLGAKVIVTETDPVRALEAHMDGFAVMPMSEAAPLGEIFITVTGCRDVLTREHFTRMRDGALLCNAGHFNVEIDTNALYGLAAERYEARQNIEGCVMPDGRTLYLLAEGRLVNLASGDGHPAEIMDMSFAVQALSVQYLAEHRGALSPGLLAVPREIDLAVAERKLATLGIKTDLYSDIQRVYLGEI